MPYFITFLFFYFLSTVQTLRNTILVSIFVGGSAFQYGFLFLNTPPNSLREQVRQIILAILLFSSFLCWANTIRYANHLAYTLGALDLQVQLIESREALEQQEKDKNKNSTLARDVDADIEFDIEIGNDNENENKTEKMAESDPRSTKVIETDKNGKNVKNVLHDIHKKDAKFLLSEGVPHPHRSVDDVLDGLKTLSVSMLSSFSLGFRFLFVAIPFGFYSAGPLALIIATAVILIFLINIDHVEKSTFSFMAGFAHTGKSIKLI